MEYASSQKLIEIKNVTKKYGQVTAVNDISFDIYQGEILGILGQNGAGKTTLIEMLEGIRRPDAGAIQVRGFEKLQNQRAYHKMIGVQLQNTSINDSLKVSEILHLFSLFHQVPRQQALSLLERFSLQDKLDRLYKNLSGGEAQLVQLVLTFLHRPQLVFLDEPTAGLDPLARRRFWSFVKENKEQGQTIILTTHYVEEAEELCDRVAILQRGHVVKLNTPQQLIAESIEPHKIIIYAENPKALDMTGIADISKLEANNTGYLLYTHNYLKTLQELLERLQKQNSGIQGMSVQKTRLEDVYIDLLGEKKTPC